jgi:hypothetical protein
MEEGERTHVVHYTVYCRQCYRAELNRGYEKAVISARNRERKTGEGWKRTRAAGSLFGGKMWFVSKISEVSMVTVQTRKKLCNTHFTSEYGRCEPHVVTEKHASMGRGTLHARTPCQVGLVQQ